MRLDYSIDLNKPQADPDMSMNGDMLLDMQSGLQNDIGSEMQQSQMQQQGQMQPISNMQPVQGGQRNVMPK